MSAPKAQAFDGHYTVEPVRYDAIGALIILRAEVTGRDENTYRFYSDGSFVINSEFFKRIPLEPPLLRAEVAGQDGNFYRFYSDGLLVRRRPREVTAL